MPTPSATDRRQRVRAILAGDACVHPGSVHDAISARIAQDLGFELGMLGDAWEFLQPCTPTPSPARAGRRRRSAKLLAREGNWLCKTQRRR